MTTRGFDRALILLGPLLGLGALVLYLVSLGGGAHPGESASYVVQAAGLIPRPSPAHPLWSALSWLVLQIPVGDIALKLNVFSAICGAVAVWFIYKIITSMVSYWVGEEDTDVATVRLASMFAGTAAAISLASCIPFWIVSNRAHPASFNIMLLVVCSWLFVQYAVSGGKPWALAFAFLYGVGIVEFETFITCAPFFGLTLLYLLLRNEELRPVLLAEIVALALAGLSLSLLAAWLYCDSPGFKLWGYKGWWDVVWSGWRNQYFLVSSSVPRQGWLLVLIMTLLPFLVAIVVARRALTGERDLGFYVLHAVMAGIFVMVVLDLGLSPWRVTAKTGALLVSPYVPAACLAGYLVAYLFLLPSSLLQLADSNRRGSICRLAGAIAVVPVFVLLGVASYRNLPAADARSAGPANLYAREVVAGMSGRSWLLTDGGFDSLMLIAAADARQPVRIICQSRDGNPSYMKYVASLFDLPRLKTLAEVGLVPLLQTWFRSDPRISEDVCVLVSPDIFAEAGLVPVPNKLSFLGLRANQLPDPASIMDSHRVFWKKMLQHVGASARAPTDEGRRNSGSEVCRRMAFVANNLGVYMEDQGCTNYAVEAYCKSREIDPENVSSLLNLATLVDRGGAANQAEAVKKAVAALKTTAVDRIGSSWELSRRYGYVRTPAAFAVLGRVWAQAGQAGLAASGLARGAALLPDGGKDDLAQVLAGMYVAQAEDTLGEAVCKELLVKDPKNTRALLGLARIALRKKHLNRVDELLSQAALAGADTSRVVMERAALSCAEGKAGEARVALERLVAAKPDLLQAWVLLCGIMVQQNELSSIESCFKRMSGIKGSQHYIEVISAHVALRKKNRHEARIHFEKALRTVPNNLYVLEQLLKLDLTEGRTESIVNSARAILRMEPGHSLANYALGCVQMEDGAKDLAEDSLRVSLRGDRIPGAMNNLAWLLQEKGQFAEAEKLAREALATSGRMPRVWDTLGVILMKTAGSDVGRMAEAEQALNNALSAVKDDPSLVLHMAILQSMKGDSDRARALLATLSSKKDRMSPSDRKDMAALAVKLGVK